MLKSALLLVLAASPSFAEALPDFDLNSARVEFISAAPLRTSPPAPEVSKASYIQITSAIKLKTDTEKGELTVTFPKVDFGDQAPGDKAHLFVKILRETPTPVISWATVLCSNGHYLGYKGSTLALPEKSGSLSITETLALGSYPKRLLARTHPWLTESLADLEEVCSGPFLEKMKDARAETLPPRLGNFNFEFNPRKNILKAKWQATSER